MRVFVLTIALLFIALFGVLTAVEIIRNGVTILGVLAILVLGLFAVAIVGAFLHRPPE